MPKGFTKKRERQVKKIKKSLKEQDKSAEEARRIAFATTNKQRREAGEINKKTKKGKKRN